MFEEGTRCFGDSKGGGDRKVFTLPSSRSRDTADGRREPRGPARASWWAEGKGTFREEDEGVDSASGPVVASHGNESWFY